MKYDVIVVGAGIAGLSSAAYLSKAGQKVLLCEKSEKVGGLINSFKFKKFTFDGGIRAIENSGIVFPMLSQLGIDIEFVKNSISIGIEDKTVKLASKSSLSDYGNLLFEEFPENQEDIARILDEISKVMRYMDILYGIDNPLFRDLKNDREYLLKAVLPWLIRYKLNINKISKLNEPVDTYLKKFTDNLSLTSIISQHFFKSTPAFFALSYFSLYLDYSYPRGGTGVIPEKLEEFIRRSGGQVSLSTEICQIDIDSKTIATTAGEEFEYDKLVWAADSKQLYSRVNMALLRSPETRDLIEARKNFIEDKSGGDSVLTVYITVDVESRYFENICGAHMFYTPSKKGLHSVDLEKLKSLDSDRKKGFVRDREAIYSWLERYYDLTTYEISCPVIRDSSLAPENQTGLIISTLMDYGLVKHIQGVGFYEEFKRFSENYISKLLSETIFPEMGSKIMDSFSSTPLTIQRVTGNSDGAITGWAFTNSEMPAENSFKKIAKSIETEVPDVFQAGQWSFSPSGLPVSILTGKLAADRVLKELK